VGVCAVATGRRNEAARNEKRRRVMQGSWLLGGGIGWRDCAGYAGDSASWFRELAF
jgi:hypothetical protein